MGTKSQGQHIFLSIFDDELLSRLERGTIISAVTIAGKYGIKKSNYNILKVQFLLNAHSVLVFMRCAVCMAQTACWT
jgi:hypothetical protein